MEEFFFVPKKIYYRTNEFRSGRPTLVFVHGLSGSSSAWLPYEKELQSVCNILSFDLRGHGKSEKPRAYSEYKIEKFAEDIDELLGYLNIKNFVLISHSFGCFVALAYLRKHQKNVSKAVFLAPHFSAKGMMSAKVISPFLSLGIFFTKRLPFSGRAGGHVDYTRHQKSGDWNVRRMFADIKNTGIRAYLYATQQSYDFDGEDFLHRITIPTLIVHGKRDTIFPVRYGVLMAGKIKGSKLVLLEDADHVLVLNKGAKVLEEIKEFVLDFKA